MRLLFEYTLAVILAFPAAATSQCRSLAVTLPQDVTALDTVQSSVAVKVRKLTLAGATVLAPADQQRLVQQITSHSYRPDSLELIAQHVRDACQRRGYFKTLVDNPRITIVEQDAQHEIVDVAVTVHVSRLYRLRDIVLRDMTAFSADELRRVFPLHSGDVFDTSKIRTGLEQLRRLYCSKGYVDFTPVPDTKIDDDTGLISLAVSVVEGPVFRVGTLTVQGEESQAGARNRLLEAWKHYQGEPYDCEALHRFLRDIDARPDLRPEQIFSLSYDQQAHVVNVQITLAKPP